jgi:DNA-binding NarL/FixJ family response regulator
MNALPVHRPIRVFIVDDHALVREWLVNLLRRECDFEVIGEAESPDEALIAMKKNPPHVAVVDISLRRGSGLDLIKQIRAELAETEAVVLSMHDGVNDVQRAFRAGAVGYVMKREATSQIVAAIRQAHSGQVFANPATLAELTTRLLDERSSDLSPLDVLSDREIDIFRRLGEGRSTTQIATELGIGLKTVHTYCARIKEKLGLADGYALQCLAARKHAL